MNMIIKILGLILLTWVGQASAAITEYSSARFDALQRAGKPVLVFIHADWCPTCKAQTKVLNQLLQGNRYRDLDILKVDFDTNTTALARFKVSVQSTLIVFVGAREVGRSTGDTSTDGITNLLSLTGVK